MSQQTGLRRKGGDGQTLEQSQASPVVRRFQNKSTNAADAYRTFNDVTSDAPAEKRFFGSLHLSPTGGLDEVGLLYNPMRYLGALVFASVLGANVYRLVSDDCRTMWSRESSTAREAWLVHEVWLDRMVPGAYVTPERIVAFFELASLLNYAVRLIVVGMTIAWPKSMYPSMPPEGQAFHRWDAVAELLSHCLPTLQSFSAMRVLQHLSPALLIPAIQKDLLKLQRQRAPPVARLFCIGQFVVWRVIYLIFGFEAFIVKFRAAAESLHLATTNPKHVILLLLFLNQMMGIVQLNIFTNQRIFQFIFGGVDNYVDDGERWRMRVWHAAFQKKCWDSSRHSFPRFLAVSLTLGDVDFQRLVLDDEPPA